MSFDGIIGNENIKQMLINAVKNNNVLHSYLFCGEEGIGKFLIAKEFAKAILCDNNSAPCEKCKSCIEFASSNNPDFYVIEPDGSSIKIEQIRYINSKVLEKPVSSKRKVYIINDSDKMTKEAQNSLLKTLEEPPEHVTFILICKLKSNVLPTIISRCTKIEFQKLTNEELQKYFNSKGEKLSEQIINLSDGSISKAIKRMSKQEVYLKLEHLVENINNIDKLEMLKQVFIYNEKDDIQDLLDVLNTLLFKMVIINNNYLNCIKIVENTKKDLKANSNFDMCIDNMLLSIWEEINEKHSWGKI